MSYQPIPMAGRPAPPQKSADQYYGHEHVARLCARFITHLFACPERPPSSISLKTRLPQFIAYALHRTKMHPSVTCASLVLLQRLKYRFPMARGSSGHQLFISAFMIASKVICDDTYSNKSWTTVAQEMFTLREINQMEREMCNCLDWELTVDNPILSNFEAAIEQDFGSSKASYPFYSWQMVSTRPIKAARALSEATPMPDLNSTTSKILQSPLPTALFESHSTHCHHTPCRSDSSFAMADIPSPRFSDSYVHLRRQGFPATTDVHYNGFSICEGIPPRHPLEAKMFACVSPCDW
ncbi:hypothetical protein V5O48_009576 [Marasmius crinis-equi]|uniref:Cyclin-like domain-containing protein n=1 Tax=Marasmius crinis-equi TaxID=585013 RepID=A0ABR3FAR7_9AGAR